MDTIDFNLTPSPPLKGGVAMPGLTAGQPSAAEPRTVSDEDDYASVDDDDMPDPNAIANLEADLDAMKRKLAKASRKRETMRQSRLDASAQAPAKKKMVRASSHGPYGRLSSMPAPAPLKVAPAKPPLGPPGPKKAEEASRPSSDYATPSEPPQTPVVAPRRIEFGTPGGGDSAGRAVSAQDLPTVGYKDQTPAPRRRAEETVSLEERHSSPSRKSDSGSRRRVSSDQRDRKRGGSASPAPRSVRLLASHFDKQSRPQGRSQHSPDSSGGNRRGPVLPFAPRQSPSGSWEYLPSSTPTPQAPKAPEQASSSRDAAQYAMLESAVREYVASIQGQAENAMMQSAMQASEAEAKAKAAISEIMGVANRNQDLAAAQVAMDAERCQREISSAQAQAQVQLAEARAEERVRMAQMEQQAQQFRLELEAAKKASGDDAAATVAAAQAKILESEAKAKKIADEAKQAVEKVQADAQALVRQQAESFQVVAARLQQQKQDSEQGHFDKFQSSLLASLERDRNNFGQQLMAGMAQQLQASVAQQERALQQQQDMNQQVLQALIGQIKESKLEAESSRKDFAGQIDTLRASVDALQLPRPRQAASRTAATRKPRALSERRVRINTAGSGGTPPPGKGVVPTLDGSPHAVTKAQTPKAKARSKSQGARPKTHDGDGEGVHYATAAPGAYVAANPGAPGGGDPAGTGTAAAQNTRASSASAKGAVAAAGQQGKSTKQPPDDDHGDSDDGDDDDYDDEGWGDEYWEEEGEEEYPRERDECESISSIQGDVSSYTIELDALRKENEETRKQLEALQSKSPKKGRKPKREADSIKVPDVYSADRFPEWLGVLHQAIVACAYNDTDGAFKWFLEIFEKSLEELSDSGDHPSLDAKLAPPLRTAIKQGRPDLAPAVQQDYDDRVAKKQQQRGRQIVWILNNKHKVREGTGKFYDIRDLFAVKCKGKDMQSLRLFQQAYVKISARVGTAVDDGTREYFYFLQIEEHPLMKDDIRDYKKAKNRPGSVQNPETYNLEWLKSCVDEVLLIDEQERARKAVSKHVDKLTGGGGAAAPGPRARGRGRGGRGRGRKTGGRGSPGGGDPAGDKGKGKGKGKGKAKAKGKGKGKSAPRPVPPADMPKKACPWFYVNGRCKNGDASCTTCPQGQHIRPNSVGCPAHPKAKPKGKAKAKAKAKAEAAPATQWKKGKLPPGSINAACAAEEAQPGSCPYGPNCAWQHPAAPKRRRGRRGRGNGQGGDGT